MDLTEQLGYRLSTPNVIQRGTQAVAATRWGAATLARTLPPIDTAVYRLTAGRQSSVSLLAGLPMVDLTTTGRRSGRSRTTHLLAIPYLGALAVIGTNFGGRATPDWVLNLEADPEATLTYRTTAAAVTARAARPVERREILEVAERTYDGYRRYQQRVTGREIRVFVLEPRSP